MDFHKLANDGKLDTLEPSLLTQENLTAKDINNWTPLH
jgi:hypothetical protein